MQRGNGGIPYAGSHGDQLSLVVVTCLIYFKFVTHCNSIQGKELTDHFLLFIDEGYNLGETWWSPC